MKYYRLLGHRGDCGEPVKVSRWSHPVNFCIYCNSWLLLKTTIGKKVQKAGYSLKALFCTIICFLWGGSACFFFWLS